MTDPPRRVEQAYPYPSELRARYREGKLFREWYELHRGTLLFSDRMLESRQIPHSGPVRDAWFFHELFLGIRYLEAGYGALFYYRQVDDAACYLKACEILGDEAAAQFIAPNSERGGRAPDLLIDDPRSLVLPLR